MYALHHTLHLQHHSHTGRLLHHRHTSYRGLAVLLVLAGACMAGITYMQRAAADALFSVSVSVHVPVPHAPAIITSPSGGDHVPAGGTIIVGSCPLVSPQPIIAISIDGTVAGSAACNANNDFSYATSLSPGQHTIVATPYTVDNDHGPAGPPLTVTAGGAIPQSSAALAFASPFMTIRGDGQADWYGTVSGPQKSYRLLLEWGDGAYQSYTVAPGEQHLTHHYARLASYNITAGLRDEHGTYQYLQTAAATNDTDALLAATNTTAPRPAPVSTIVGLYGLFVTLVCISGIARLHADPFAYAPLRIGHHAKG